METTATLIVQGLVLSSMYILVALGFGLLLSIMGIFNFAHGAIYMVGAYITYGLAVSIGINQWVALFLSIVIMALFGLSLERLAFRPFVGNSNATLMMAIAVILILETSVNVSVGGFTRSLPPFVDGVAKVGGVSVSWERLVTLAVGALLLVAMTLLVRRGKIGQQMLAVAQDKVGATLQGISINRVSSFATVLACCLAALAGSMMASLLSLTAYMGDNILFKAIEVVIISGIGSIGGIFFGGLIIGFLDATLPVYLGAAEAQAITLGIIIVLLLFRPKGLFGYELF
jgi:branched-chain amino acid transport system permease protein